MSPQYAAPHDPKAKESIEKSIPKGRTRGERIISNGTKSKAIHDINGKNVNNVAT